MDIGAVKKDKKIVNVTKGVTNIEQYRKKYSLSFVGGGGRSGNLNPTEQPDPNPKWAGISKAYIGMGQNKVDPTNLLI